jgi:acyl-CoA synthetase (AMP-forming)/AMP-acid ligase II
VERRAETSPERVMLVDEARGSLSFGALRARAERAAAGFHKLGIGAGTPVSWQLPTWIEAYVLVAALSRLGAIQNPLLPLYREREVRFAASQTGARWLIVPTSWRGVDYQEMARSVAAELPDCEVLVCDRAAPDADPSMLPPLLEPPASPEAAPVRWVFYTSGTTADPKGALHTDASILAAALASSRATGTTDADRVAVIFPFTHIGGIQGMMRSLLTGSSGAVVEIFDPQRSIGFLSEQGVTDIGGATPIHLACLAAQRAAPDRTLFPRLRVCPSGGAAVPLALHREVRAELGGVGLVAGYGLTEFPVMTMNSLDASDAALSETVGRPTAGVEVRVVTADGRLADPGETGEIRGKGPQMCRGYLDPALTRDAFDEEGYLRTGDLGHVDADGHVVITGRLKDIIIRKGENISAKEVEDVLYAHPRVRDVAVIGLPDPACGERCCAVVAVVDPAEPFGFEEMTSFCREQGLMIQKIPEQLEILDEIPRNPVGKVMKHVLRESYGATRS